MADDPFSYAAPLDDDDIGNDENIKLGLGGLISPASAQSLVPPPPNSPPKSGPAQSTPITGSLAGAPQQSQPKVSGPDMIPGIATKPENLGLPQPSTAPNSTAAQFSRDQASYNALAGSKPGVDTIKNRWGSILAKTGDIAGSILTPGIAQWIPGSTLNHQREVNTAAGRVAQDQGLLNQQAQIQDVQSQTTQRAAQAQRNQAIALEDRPRAITAPEAQAAGLDPSIVGSMMKPSDIASLVKAGNAPDKAPKMQLVTGPDGNQYWANSGNPSAPAQPVMGPGGQPLAKQPKPLSDNDKYIQIMSKPPAQRTAEDNAWMGAFRQLNKETRIDPGVQRAEIYVGGRPVQTIDPNDPNNVIYQSAGQAERQGASAPAGIGFQTRKNVTKDFTSGTDARTLTAFNTASSHLQLLQQAADALQNGNLQVANRLGQAYAEQTGGTAPTNFAMVKAALAGELSKTFTGGRATEQEINTLNSAINRAQSPAQLNGVISSASRLMNSKRGALLQQYQSGIQGQPNFGGQNQLNTSPQLTPQQRVMIRPGKGSTADRSTMSAYLVQSGGSAKEARTAMTRDGWVIPKKVQ